MYKDLLMFGTVEGSSRAGPIGWVWELRLTERSRLSMLYRVGCVVMSIDLPIFTVAAGDLDAQGVCLLRMYLALIEHGLDVANTCAFSAIGGKTCAKL